MSAPPNTENPTAGVILAAGLSRRFGTSKLLARFRGRPLIHYVLDAARRSELARIVLVLGHRHRETARAVAAHAADPRVRVVYNPLFRLGQSTSLRCGLSAVKNDFSSVMFLVADQPLLDAETIDLLLHRYWASDKDICVPVFCGARGNPTLFSSRMYGPILAIRGDTGARPVIDAFHDRVLEVPLPGRNVLDDVDTPKDLSALTDQKKK